MTVTARSQQIQDIQDVDISFSLYKANNAYTSAALLVRRDSDDLTTSVYYNDVTGMVDDDSFIADGVTTLSTWKDANSPADLYVYNWFDLSGNGNHLGQGVLANQPKVVLSGVGSVARLLFDGVSTSMYYTFSRFSSPSTLFIVYQKTATQAMSAGLFASETSTNAGAYQLIYGSNKLVLDTTQTSPVPPESPLPVEDDSTLDINLVDLVMGSSNDIDIYFNRAGNSYTRTGGFLSTYYRYTIGTDITGTWFYQGYVDSLIVVKRALADNERKSIENNLIKTHGILV